MNAIYEIEKRRLPKFSQSIVMNLDGFVVESCDSIFPTKALREIKVTDWFHLMESIFPSLQDLKLGGAEITFSKIHSPFEILPGFYDFSFSKVKIQEQDYILWFLYDYTFIYQEYLMYQQRKNELDIHRQFFEHKNRNITSVNEIIENRTYFQSYLDKNRYGTKYSTVVLHTLSANNSKLDSLFDFDQYEGLPNYTSRITGIVHRFQNEIDTFLIGNAEFLYEKFTTSGLEKDLKEALKNLESGSRFSIKSAIDQNKKIIIQQRIISQVLYSLILNSANFNPNQQLSISLQLEENPNGKTFLKTLLLEELGASDEKIKTSYEMKLRFYFLKVLLGNHGGSISARYQEEPNSLAIIFKMPVKIG